VYTRATYTTSKDVATTSPRALVNIKPDFGAELAKFVFLYLKYASRSYFVSCPFLRTDIAPLTPVRLQLPRWREVASALESATIYGLVQSVSITANAAVGSVETVLEIGFARTKADQYDIVDPAATRHPLWSSLWQGSNLRA
jgi:hypothetical protein